MTLSPTPATFKVKQKGLTLLETVLALAVGVVIIMSVLIYFQSASNTANMAATIKITSDIGNAVRAYAQSPAYKPGNITLADLQAGGLLTGADTVNPWSGSLVVSTSGNYLGITFYNVPAQSTTTSGVTTVSGSCALLAGQLSRSLPLPSPGTVTLNGNTYKYTGTYTISNAPSGGGVIIKGSGGGNGKKANGAAVCQYSSGTTGKLTVVMDLT